MRGAKAITFNRRPVAERLAIAREQGERLHPGYAKYVEHGVAIGWENMEFARGGWVNEDDPNFGANSAILAQAAGRASTWRATSSPSCRAGRKARSSRRITRSLTSTGRCGARPEAI